MGQKQVQWNWGTVHSTWVLQRPVQQQSIQWNWVHVPCARCCTSLLLAVIHVYLQCEVNENTCVLRRCMQTTSLSFIMFHIPRAPQCEGTCLRRCSCNCDCCCPSIFVVGLCSHSVCFRITSDMRWAQFGT